VAGALPAGVTLGSNCTLSGTPGAAGSYTFTVRINDQGGSVVTVGYSLNVQVLTIPTLAGGALLLLAMLMAAVALGRGRIAPPEFVGNTRRRG